MLLQHKIDENIVLDNYMSVRDILETYEEITIGEQILEDILFFTLFEKTFLFFPPDKDNPSSKANVYLYWIFHI